MGSAASLGSYSYLERRSGLAFGALPMDHEMSTYCHRAASILIYSVSLLVSLLRFLFLKLVVELLRFLLND